MSITLAQITRGVTYRWRIYLPLTWEFLKRFGVRTIGVASVTGFTLDRVFPGVRQWLADNSPVAVRAYGEAMTMWNAQPMFFRLAILLSIILTALFFVFRNLSSEEQLFKAHIGF